MRVRMIRKLWIATLIAALLLIGGAPVAAQEASQVDRTRIRVFVPFGPRGLSTELSIESDVEGTCDSSSLASSGRPDAWRCMSENLILDPCFLQVMGDGTVFACAESPWGLGVTRLTVAFAAPFGDATFDPRTALPWALELGNGKQCTSLTGATFGLVGLRANYGCVDGGLIFGEPDRSEAVWQVLYYPEDGGYSLEQVDVLTAWY